MIERFRRRAHHGRCTVAADVTVAASGRPAGGPGEDWGAASVMAAPEHQGSSPLFTRQVEAGLSQARGQPDIWPAGSPAVLALPTGAEFFCYGPGRAAPDAVCSRLGPPITLYHRAQPTLRRCFSEIGCRRHQPRIVPITAEPDIAGLAKQAADLAGRMTVIDAKPPFRGGLPADRTDAGLRRQQPCVVLQRDPVYALESRSPSLLTIPLASLQPDLRIGGISVPQVLVDCILVKVITGTAPGQPGFAIFRVFGVPLPSPFVLLFLLFLLF
jgi:hypothetical protein